MVKNMKYNLKHIDEAKTYEEFMERFRGLKKELRAMLRIHKGTLIPGTLIINTKVIKTIKEILGE